MVAARIEEVTDAMLAGYMQEIEAYASLDNPAALAEVRSITRMNVRVILHAIADGTPLDDATLGTLRELGRLRAAQGFPLHALLRAYQIGTRIAWRYILESLAAAKVDSVIAAEVVASVSIAILEITGQVSSAVSGAFLETERETAATEERVRRDVFNELISGPAAGAEPLRERAGFVGYKLGDAHAVAVITIPDPNVARTHTDAIVDALKKISIDQHTPIIDSRNFMIIALFVVGPNVTERRITDALDKVLSSSKLQDVVAQGALGRIEGGVSGIAVSYRQAVRALDAARSLRASAGVASYVDLLPSLLLMHDASLSKDLFRATVEPLVRNDAEQGTQFVATLAAMFEERGNLIAAAKRLFVHRHTLTARIERIEELTGRSLRNRTDLLLLELGLRAREVLPDGDDADAATRHLGWLDDLSRFRDSTLDNRSLPHDAVPNLR